MAAETPVASSTWLPQSIPKQTLGERPAREIRIFVDAHAHEANPLHIRWVTPGVACGIGRHCLAPRHLLWATPARNDAVRELAGQLHHLGSECTDINWHARR